ncbi:MAG: ABC transporter ATP-binding protein [Chloroflexi bacterium]|nr:ABC transporter ATP-binding protein [Chloroflexota bacterium]
MMDTNISRLGKEASASQMASASSKVRIDGLTKIFDVRQAKVIALDEVSLTIPEGQFLCIVGPSGCGKTTLLRILGGLETPTSGGISVGHRDRSSPVNSMIFQEQSVFPWMTVTDNITYGLRMRGVDKKTRDEIAQFYINKVGLRKFATAYPFQLSGGMKQRVSVARAFANDPEIFLMDEPFAALDEQNKLLLQEELLRIWDETRKTVIFITHSIDEAIVLSDRVIVMTAHPGKVKADVPVDFPRPRRVYELRAKPEFGELFLRIWEYLRDEVLKAKKEEGAE